MPLSESELEAFLSQPRIAHLATSFPRGNPRVSPIWYAYRNGCFYFTTELRLLKGRHLQRNPRVALSIASEEQPYRAVCAFGMVEYVQKNRDEWLGRISTRYGERQAQEWLKEVMKQPDRVVFKLRPERIMSWHYGRGDGQRQERGESMATPV